MLVPLNIVLLGFFFFFFFNDTATTEIYTLSLHDALPISATSTSRARARPWRRWSRGRPRSEEHTSELQSHVKLVCRLLLEKKKPKTNNLKLQYKKIQALAEIIDNRIT